MAAPLVRAFPPAPAHPLAPALLQGSGSHRKKIKWPPLPPSSASPRFPLILPPPPFLPSHIPSAKLCCGTCRATPSCLPPTSPRPPPCLSSAPPAPICPLLPPATVAAGCLSPPALGTRFWPAEAGGGGGWTCPPLAAVAAATAAAFASAAAAAAAESNASARVGHAAADGWHLSHGPVRGGRSAGEGTCVQAAVYQHEGRGAWGGVWGVGVRVGGGRLVAMLTPLISVRSGRTPLSWGACGLGCLVRLGGLAGGGKARTCVGNEDATMCRSPRGAASPLLAAAA